MVPALTRIPRRPPHSASRGFLAERVEDERIDFAAMRVQWEEMVRAEGSAGGDTDRSGRLACLPAHCSAHHPASPAYAYNVAITQKKLAKEHDLGGGDNVSDRESRAKASWASLTASIEALAGDFRDVRARLEALKAKADAASEKVLGDASNTGERVRDRNRELTRQKGECGALVSQAEETLQRQRTMNSWMMSQSNCCDRRAFAILLLLLSLALNAVFITTLLGRYKVI